MALDKGKKQVFRKTIDTSVPYVPAKSYASIAFDNLKPTFDRIQADQEKTAQANYFFDFSMKTKEFFDQARIDNQFDANGMKQAVDSYSKNLLETVPAKYKIQASAMLANYSMSSINYAATQKDKLDKDNKFGNRDINWQNFNTETEFQMNTFTDHKLDIGLTGINQSFINGLKTTNELLHDDNENFVKTGDITLKAHNANSRMQIKDLAIARGFNIMKLMYKNGMEAEALNWLNELNQGKDKTPLNPETDMMENPTWKMFSYIMNDANGRQEVVDGIKSLYEGFHHENILGKSQKSIVDIEALKEPNQILSLENFKGGAVDGNALAENLGLEVGSTKYNNFIKYVAEANNAARVVAMTMQNPDKKINWKDEGVTPELWAKSLLAMNGIHKVRFSDLNSDGFKTAINLMARQNYYPPQLADALKVSNSGNWKDEETLKQFANKALIYQYAKTLYPNEEFPPIYSQALEGGAIDEIANGNFTTATSIMEGIKSEDTPKRFESILLNEDSEKNFRHLFNEKVKSPNWIMEMISGGKGELNKHLFSPADQSTFFAIVPSNIMSPVAYTQFKEIFYQTIANETIGTDIDPWKEGNEKLLERAWHISSRKMKQGGWGIETNTFDGKAKLVKDPYHNTYGTVNDNDIYSHVFKNFSQMSKEEKMSTFLTNNWADVQEMLNLYFDDNQGNVKIAIDRQNYNDENGLPAYKLSMWQGDTDSETFNFVISLDGNFKPAGWMPTEQNNNTGSIVQYKNDTANEIFETFKDTSWYKKLPGDEANWTKRAIHSIIRNSISLSDYRFYPDLPGFDGDVKILGATISGDPKELRPFAWIARMMGFDGDLREIQSELNLAKDIATNNLSYQSQINANRDLTNNEKVIESLLPPEKLVMNENAMAKNFKHYALTNYQNTDLRLTHRTNNWMAVSSDNWDGELPVNYNRDSRNFAVFSHPKHSVRAAVKSIINHSTLTAKLNGVDKRYGSEPTIEDILTMYAQDSKSYLKALDQHTNFEATDTINLMDANQMHQLVKFMIQHEMGFEYFEEKFGLTNAYVDSVIYAGFNEAINSYNGELGKL